MKVRFLPVITGVLHLSPGTLIGTKMPLRPQDPIELHLKGVVSPQVEEIIDNSGLTVVVRDGQPYSLDELTELQASMTEVLKELGIDESSCSVGLPPSGAQVYLTCPHRQAGMDRDEVRQLLAARLPQPFMALVSMSDDGPIPTWIPQSSSTP